MLHQLEIISTFPPFMHSLCTCSENGRPMNKINTLFAALPKIASYREISFIKGILLTINDFRVSMSRKLPSLIEQFRDLISLENFPARHYEKIIGSNYNLPYLMRLFPQDFRMTSGKIIPINGTTKDDRSRIYKQRRSLHHHQG